MVLEVVNLRYNSLVIEERERRAAVTAPPFFFLTNTNLFTSQGFTDIAEGSAEFSL